MVGKTDSSYRRDFAVQPTEPRIAFAVSIRIAVTVVVARNHRIAGATAIWAEETAGARSLITLSKEM